MYAVSLGERAGSTKNVCTGVRRGGPGALVSLPSAIVHFGGALAASSVGTGKSLQDYTSQKAM